MIWLRASFGACHVARGLLCSSLRVLKRPGHRSITDPRPVSHRRRTGTWDKLTSGHQPRVLVLAIEIVWITTDTCRGECDGAHTSLPVPRSKIRSSLSEVRP